MEIRKLDVAKVLNFLNFLVSILFTLYILSYFLTGLGGSIKMAVTLVPVLVIINVLASLGGKGLYPRFGHKANYIVAGVYIALCILVSVYMNVVFDDITYVRMGSYITLDVIVGVIALVLVMEYARRRHFILFCLNLFLMFYAVCGRIFPGLLGHAGVSMARVLTLCSVELDTGVFSSLSQLALTLIASFLLLAAIAYGFGCQESLIRASRRIAGKSVYGVPETAAVSSFLIATISGSGAANAAITGSFTIPLMKKHGFSSVTAGAVETATSIGGQLMPPIMGISAFIMCDLLGVTYFDVIARGVIIGIIYYLGVAFAIYLYSIKVLGPKPTVLEQFKLELLDKFNTAIFICGILFLVYLMGIRRMGAMYAAFLTSGLILTVFVTLRIYLLYRLNVKNKLKELAGCFLRSVERFTTLTCDIGLLLATLGIMVGLFTVTGVPIKIGIAMTEVGGGNLLLLIALGFAFGYMVGLGIPPAGTYIMIAAVVVPVLISVGFNPWVAHFFAFTLAVASELAPPTSVATSVTSRIAGSPFVRTVFESVKLAFPLYLLMFSVFTRQDLVIEPGLSQILAGVLVLLGILGFVTFIHATYSERLFLNIPLKVLTFIFVALTLFHPNITLAIIAAIATLALILFGVFQTRRIAAKAVG